MALRLSISIGSKPNSFSVGIIAGSRVGEEMLVGFENTTRMPLSLSIRFLKLVNTSGMSFIENGKSSA